MADSYFQKVRTDSGTVLDCFRVFEEELNWHANYRSSRVLYGLLSFLASLYNLMILLGRSADSPRPPAAALVYSR